MTQPGIEPWSPETLVNTLLIREINSDNIFFLSCPRHCDQRLIAVIEYYFQICDKKEHNIIIRSVSSSHMGPMYIEKLYIFGAMITIKI